MFDSTEEFYKLFEQYPKEFADATSYEEFCKRIGKEYLTRRLWPARLFVTAKAGKFTYKPLYFPSINTYAELFEGAKFLPTPTEKQNVIPVGYMFLGGSGSLCMHVGGKRDWSKTSEGTRAQYGATFYGTYVKPRADVYNVKMTLVDHAKNYEAIKREDGILIIAEDGMCIGSEWLALLPLTENIENLFDADTQQMIATEREAEKIAWGD